MNGMKMWIAGAALACASLGCGGEAQVGSTQPAGDSPAPTAQQATTATRNTPAPATAVEFDEAMAMEGRMVFTSFGCNSCHDANQVTPMGADLRGLFGSTVTLADGTTVTADEDYIRESILEPSAKITAGFQPLMPDLSDMLDEEDTAVLIEYIKSLGAEAAE